MTEYIDWGKKYYDGEITAEEYYARTLAETMEGRLQKLEREEKDPKAARKRQLEQAQRRLSRRDQAKKYHREMYPERYQGRRKWWTLWRI